MLEFNNHLKNRDSVKIAFPGATVSQINHYVHASLIEDNLTTLVICARTNKLTKKNQTADQTAQEIIEIAKSCHQDGVSNIFVSGITCRPKFKVKIAESNKLLKYNAVFLILHTLITLTFVNNICGKMIYILTERVHTFLANNYLAHFNRPALLPFDKIWD